MSDPVRVRFAPSPTGYLHIGGARTSLFNWLFAKKQRGTFVLRLEDTDAERNTEAARQTIFRGLDWLGLTPDEGPEQGGPYGPYAQSERQSIYIEWGKKLSECDGAYPCFCTRERLSELRAQQEKNRETLRYDRKCRSLTRDEAAKRMAAGEECTWRLKVPEEGKAVIADLVRGTVTVDYKDIEDIILVRGNGVPIYNFAVVIDDHLMRITHVIRGEDHLTNTFKQLLIYRALGWKEPIFAHLPLILAPAGEGKLSKRKHPEAACELYQQKGYPVEGLINWLALVGWSFDDKTEIMSRAELIERFSLDRVVPSGARLPLEKLDWICGDYIRRTPVETIEKEITPFLQAKGWISKAPSEGEKRRIALIAANERERLRNYGQVVELAAWIFEDGQYEEKAALNLKKEGAIEMLADYAPTLLASDFAEPTMLEAEARAWCEARGYGFGKLVHPVRAALTFRTQGPGLFACAVILGKDECKRRIEKALAFARGPAGGGCAAPPDAKHG